MFKILNEISNQIFKDHIVENKYLKTITIIMVYLTFPLIFLFNDIGQLSILTLGRLEEDRLNILKFDFFHSILKDLIIVFPLIILTYHSGNKMFMSLSISIFLFYYVSKPFSCSMIEKTGKPNFLFLKKLNDKNWELKVLKRNIKIPISILNGRIGRRYISINKCDELIYKLKNNFERLKIGYVLIFHYCFSYILENKFDRMLCSYFKSVGYSSFEIENFIDTNNERNQKIILEIVKLLDKFDNKDKLEKFLKMITS